MRVDIQETGSRELAAALKAAPEKLRRGIAQAVYATGSRAVAHIKRRYRTSGGADSTWRRSGRLVNSYAHEVKRVGRDITLDIGAIRPTDQGQVPIHARVHEGIDAQGNRVDEFIIRPVRAPYLHFPIRQHGGLSSGNITGWVRTTEVRLKPRPALEPIRENVARQLLEDAERVVADVV